MEEIKELLAITKKLREKYVHLNKTFSLDGKLVGDIGEVLAAEKYGIALYPENTPVHDGYEVATGKKVQIKATFVGGSYFPSQPDKMPDYFLSVFINEDGSLEEQYNGPSQFLINEYIIPNGLKGDKTGYILAKGKLKEVNDRVHPDEKIKEVQ